MFANPPYRTEYLQPVFDRFILKPFREHPATPAWKKEVLDRLPDYSYHSSAVLRNGQADFRDGHNDLPPEDKVLLYCYYYMQMHVVSGHHVFETARHRIRQENRNLITDGLFIDIGCGPGTAAVALAWCNNNIPLAERSHEKPLLKYFGIDNAPAMLDMASRITRESGLFHEASLFHFAPSFTEREKVDSIVDLIGKHLAGGSFLVFNFSYAIASSSLLIGDLTDFISHVLDKHPNLPAVILFQNPRGHTSGEKWQTFKRRLSMFREYIVNREEIRYSDSVSKSRADPWPIRLHFEMLVKP